MKFNIHIALLFSALSITAILSCSKEKDTFPLGGPNGNSVVATACDFIPGNPGGNDVTKVVVSREGSSALSFSWNEGDVIGVVPMNGRTTQSNFEITELGNDTRTAMFDGGVWALKPGMEYAAYYPYMDFAFDSTLITILSVDTQEQCGNDNIDHLADYDFMYAKAVAPAEGVANFNFSHIISIVRLQITVPGADCFSEVSLSSDVEWFARYADIYISNGNIRLPFSLENNFTLPLKGGVSISEGEMLTVWLAVIPVDVLSGQKLVVRLPGVNAVYSAEIPINTTWEAGKAYSYNCTAVEVFNE